MKKVKSKHKTANSNNTLLGEVIIDKIIEQYADETFLKADGFDEAIIGVDETTMRLIYSVSKCIEILMRDMSEEDAMEHFSFILVFFVGYAICCSAYMVVIRNASDRAKITEVVI